MKLELNQITSVYSGKDGCCCCGCKGKYYYPTHKAALAEKRGGTINDRMVKRVLNKINDVMAMPSDIQKAYKLDEHASYVAIVEGRRLYIVHYNNE